eukprot:TRINITY_DN4823_c1_g1_i1.p2 TRINITY_DN4823_c1_g1~~TRINITY_DN4823_c1_g1_i1.p2  ORF type:complete len:305 (-),score=3.65 TRINITY_DN4823_c1_g1_i1:224-1138(-)
MTIPSVMSRPKRATLQFHHFGPLKSGFLFNVPFSSFRERKVYPFELNLAFIFTTSFSLLVFLFINNHSFFIRIGKEKNKLNIKQLFQKNLCLTTGQISKISHRQICKEKKLCVKTNSNQRYCCKYKHKKKLLINVKQQHQQQETGKTCIAYQVKLVFMYPRITCYNPFLNVDVFKQRPPPDDTEYTTVVIQNNSFANKLRVLLNEVLVIQLYQRSITPSGQFCFEKTKSIRDNKKHLFLLNEKRILKNQQTKLWQKFNRMKLVVLFDNKLSSIIKKQKLQMQVLFFKCVTVQIVYKCFNVFKFF